jgi:hypothetical protein
MDKVHTPKECDLLNRSSPFLWNAIVVKKKGQNLASNELNIFNESLTVAEIDVSHIWNVGSIGFRKKCFL